MKKLNIRKAMETDGVSNWTLKKCRKDLVEPVWDVINTSLKGQCQRSGKEPEQFQYTKEE